MKIEEFVTVMPKIELHVHLEGSIQPETLLILAKRNNIKLPGSDIDSLRKWYDFKNFDHFIEVYMTISSCLCTTDDIELIAREFFKGQAAQNIHYSEVIYTPYSQYSMNGIAFKDQLAALNRALQWAERELHVSAGWVMDISRHSEPEEGMLVANWAISGMSDRVIALGLGGPEVGNPPEKFTSAFSLARQAGLKALPHAGETVGPTSIWGALKSLDAVRIGHGVRCLEDSELVHYLREYQVPLDVSTTSNVCLKVVPDLESHPLPRLMSEGLVVTLNSDDPPMFNTNLTNELINSAKVFNFSEKQLEKFTYTALDASLLMPDKKYEIRNEIDKEFARLNKSI